MKEVYGSEYTPLDEIAKVSLKKLILSGGTILVVVREHNDRRDLMKEYGEILVKSRAKYTIKYSQDRVTIEDIGEIIIMTARQIEDAASGRIRGYRFKAYFSAVELEFEVNNEIKKRVY